MSNDYPPPGSGQDPTGENQPPPPPPPPPGSEPQGYGQPGYGPAYTPPPAYPPPPPGTPPAAYGGYGQPVQTSPLAIVSLVLGIVGLLCCTFFVLGIGAAVTGFLARKQISESQGRLKGAGMALAGLILGIASIVLAVVYWGLVIAGAIDANFNFETT